MKRRICAAALAMLFLCGCGTAPTLREVAATTTATTKATTAKATTTATSESIVHGVTYQDIANVLNNNPSDGYSVFEATAQKDGVLLKLAVDGFSAGVYDLLNDYTHKKAENWETVIQTLLSGCNDIYSTGQVVSQNCIIEIHLLDETDLSKVFLRIRNGVVIYDITEDVREKNPLPISYVAELTNGNYTSGIDFPAGVYDIEAIEGTGNVISSNMFNGGLNMVMSADDPERAKSFQNAKLPNGVILEIKNGVKIRISCDEADGKPLAKREQPNTETITLKNGNYIAGADFPAGVYNVIAVDGSGSVSSDNMFDGGINSIMSTQEDNFNDWYEQEYKNIELPDGVMLTVKNVEIQLVPST